MAFINIKFPVLVQNVTFEDKPQYYLRPLFGYHPFAEHHRFKTAVSKLQNEVKRYFNGYKLNRSSAEYLMWFMFNPSLEYHQFQYDFSINKEYKKGIIGVASFQLNKLTFAYLPKFNNYLFIVSYNEELTDLRSKVFNVATKLFKEYQQKDEDNDFEIEKYFSNKKEFVTEMSMQVNIKNDQFKFEKTQDDWIRALMYESNDFEGNVEIEKVGYDLNQNYPGNLNRAVFVDDLIEKIYPVIFEETNTPIAIVGENGVGRHTLIHELVYRYMEAQENNSNYRQRIWHIDPTRIISGMSIVGQWQKRLEAIISFIRQPIQNTKISHKMLVDNPVALLRIGKSAQNNMTLSDVIKPYLEKRQFQLIMIASPEEWKLVQEKDRRFSDLFQVVRLKEPDLATSSKIILHQRRALEIEYNTNISIQAIKQLFAIYRNYLKNSALPGGIMKMLERLAIKYRNQRIDIPEVRNEFKSMSGLEERIFDSSQQIESESIEKMISRKLVGQAEAAKSLADVVHLIKAKLVDKSKPVSSFLFIGPTGVGKTQAAKVLSEFLMGDQSQLIRFDMNEFIDEYAVQRLIGDYNNPEGQLTSKVRYQPFGILLLDEIEKAHAKVHDLLLQVLDDGRLTDSLGRTVDFTNTIIIMTSNVGAAEVSSQLGYVKSQEDVRNIYRKAVEKRFRPEFVNRIDKIVIFQPLKLEHILGIAQLQIKELLQRDGFVRRTTILNISDDALEWVARRGFNERMGGRALKRQIEKDLTALSAEQLIATSSETPVIMDIELQEDHLKPHITSLDFAKPSAEEIVPGLPERESGHRFFKTLLNKLEAIEETIRIDEESKDIQDDVVIAFDSSESFSQIDTYYYQYKSKVNETKEDLNSIILGYQNPYFKVAPAIPLRLRIGDFFPKRDFTGSKGIRENIKDYLFQTEAIKEISESYYFGTPQFDSSKTEFIDYFINVHLLKLYLSGVLEDVVDKIKLQFRSSITGLGNWEIQFMIEKYVNLCVEMDLTHEVHLKEKYLTIEGYSVFELFKGEAGIHLFYLAHQNPLPIELKVIEMGEDISNTFYPPEVIRIYDGSTTLTDIRTGYTNAMDIRPSEHKLLLYAGIESSIRYEL